MELATQRQDLLEKARLAGTSPPYLKIGSRVMYDESELEAWLAEQPRFRSTADDAPRSRRRPSPGRPKGTKGKRPRSKKRAA